MRDSNIYSHCGKLLEEHVANVINLAVLNLHSKSEELQKVNFIISFAHDLGKATNYFQEYLKASCNGLQSQKNRLTNHALIGGLAGLYLSDKVFDYDFYKILCFIIPKRHHGDLNDVFNDLTIKEDKDILIKQIDSINKENFNAFLINLKNKIINKKFNHIIDLFELDDFKDFVSNKSDKKLKELKLSFLGLVNSKLNIDSFIETVLSYSVLLDADKSDAGIGLDSILKLKSHQVDLSANVVNSFVSKLNENKDLKINEIRNKAFLEVLDKQIDLDKKIYSLTLPTGTGKTLLSLMFAFRLYEKIKENVDYPPIIIYSLPFLSIIEQNYNVVEKVLSYYFKDRIPNNVLLKHHHLSEISYRVKKNNNNKNNNEDEEYDFDTSRVLFEGWESQLIITTFIQFFYTLLSNKNKTLRRFNKLQNAIVILDEIQSIPVNYWKVINDVFVKMAEKFNFYVILSTATQPLIFEQTEEIIENKDYYFNSFNRYVINVDLEGKTIDNFLRSLNLDNDKSYMFILNTIKSSKKLFNKIKESYSNRNVEYLSTNIVPAERKRRIENIKSKLEKGEKIILITTQLIEAGVDVDFDVVYRDFAPFDSIVQSAGRCNRNGLKDKGYVNLIKLIDDHNDDHNRYFYSYIYDSVLCSITDELIKDFSNIEEKEIFELISRYYRLTKERKVQDKELINALKSLNFDGTKDEITISKFELIKEKAYESDVFIQLNDDAVGIWKEFEEILKIPDIFKRKEKFTKLKPKFYDYVISVNVKSNTPPDRVEDFMYLVKKEIIDDYYDFETGFILKSDDVLII
jgi:CRISPR-associated endonuclease/helicase Cas3